MIGVPGRLSRWVLACLLVFGLATVPVAAAGADDAENATQLPTNASVAGAAEPGADSETVDTATGSYTADSAGPDVELTQELRRVPDRPGIFEASHRYHLPSNLALLEVTIPDGATVVAVDGFVEGDEPRTHRWDGRTETPEIEYRLPGNRSIDRTGPIAGPGQLLFVDVGEWAVVRQPNTGHRWSWTGTDRVGFDRNVRVDGPGAVGDTIAYLGAHDSYTHRAHGQRFRLIVPRRANLAERPAEIFESLADASGTLRVGDRDEEVFMIATPTESVDWGVRGLQTGPADIWTRDLERLDTADNVWLHEYVHSRQSYARASDIEWFTEGSATYYAALLALEQDRISFEQFRNRLAVGTSERRFAGSVLADPGSWQSNANYHVGALVSGELDRRLRLATDRDSSLQEILRRLNAREGVATGESFRQFLRAVGGESVATGGEELTTTTVRPPMWAETEHRSVFEGTPAPARITYALSETPLEVTGPYRNRTLDAVESLVFVPGETVSFGVNATNFGEQAGEYEAVFRVDGERIDGRTASLDPGESHRLEFDHRFERTGEFVLSVGDVQLLASVRDPATPALESFSVNRSEITAGERIRLTARLANGADRPAATTLSFTRDGAQFDTGRLRLDVGESATVAAGVRIEEPGTYVFGLGDQFSDTVVVTVADPPPDGSNESDTADDSTEDANSSAADEQDGTVPEEQPGTDETGNGFGFVAAILAVLAVVLRVGHSSVR